MQVHLVAKHGNRKISSAAGSSDVLEELGIRSDFSTEETTELLRQEGLHSYMRHRFIRK